VREALLVFRFQKYPRYFYFAAGCRTRGADAASGGRIDADAAISAEFAPTGAGQGCADLQPHDEQQPRGGKQRTSSAPGIGFAHREQTTVLLG